MMSSTAYPESDLAGEPSLEELFAEPIVRLIMKRDGVNDADLRGQIDRVKHAYHVHETAQ